MKKIILFGSNGFIGSNIKHLLLENKNFKLVSISSSICDLTSIKNVSDLINQEKPQVIINAAFKGVSANISFSTDYIFENTLMVTNILEACRGQEGIEKIIHFGSCTEYGDSDFPISEEFSLAPKNIYGTAKAISSLSALQLSHEYGLPLIILRPFYLYGPGDDKSVLYYLMDALVKNKTFSLTAGAQIRDYMYIVDLAKIIITMLESINVLKGGGIYNIGTGQGIRLGDVFSKVFEIFGKIPNYNTRDYSKYEYFSQVADNHKIKSLINIDGFTRLDEGIKAAFEWVRFQQ